MVRAYLRGRGRDCVEIVRALWVTRMCTSAIGVIYGSCRSVSLTWAHHQKLTVAHHSRRLQKAYLRRRCLYPDTWYMHMHMHRDRYRWCHRYRWCRDRYRPVPVNR